MNSTKVAQAKAHPAPSSGIEPHVPWKKPLPWEETQPGPTKPSPSPLPIPIPPAGATVVLTDGREVGATYAVKPGVAAGSLSQAMAAAAQLKGPVGVVAQPSTDTTAATWRVGPLTSIGNVSTVIKQATGPGLFQAYRGLAAAPTLAAVTWGAASFVPLDGVGSGATVARSGKVWSSWNRDLVIQPGAQAASLQAAIEAASLLSNGNSGAHVVLDDVTRQLLANGAERVSHSYWVHPVKVEGVLQTRLEPRPFSHDLTFEEDPLSFPSGKLGDLAANVVAFVDGDVVVAPTVAMA